MIRPLLLTFIPLFVAVDVVAVVLVYLGIGMPLDETARRRLVLEATMTAVFDGSPDVRVARESAGELCLTYRHCCGASPYSPQGVGRAPDTRGARDRRS